MKAVVLQIRESVNEKSRCLGRVAYDGVADLGSFRVFLEGVKGKAIVPWPFDFWDSQLDVRVATELEQINTLELHDHVVTLIRCHGGQSMAGQESMAIKDPIMVQECSVAGCISPAGDQNEAVPRITSLSRGPVDCAAPLSSCEQEVQEKTSCLKLEPKHKIFLSHSGAQKPFAEQLCKDLEAQNQNPFFDQRSDCLPKGEKFSTLIIDAAKICKVAVIVLSREYLSSKWPMLELVEFVRARRSENKSLKLFPLFYKASVEDLSDKAIQIQWRPRWMELVGGDPRVDLEHWAAAVRELRGVNGLRFDKFGNSEVSYRDGIVQEIFMLTPPNLLYDTSNIFGCDRICKILADKFLPDARTPAQVLGLYGISGLGKTTMAKSLCNHFNKRFSGRVCYIEIKEEVKALERQHVVMRKLLGSQKLLLQNVCDVSEGWGLLQSRMKQYPVFLVIDNVQHDGTSEDEARKYLNVEYHPGSKIMVISRSLDVLGDLLGDSRYCFHMPCLEKDEVARILLQDAGPLLDYSSLTKDERKGVKNCIGNAWFHHQIKRQKVSYNEKPSYEIEAGHYHPLAARALGVYLHERSHLSGVLSWNTYLHEYGKLKDTRKSYRQMFNILGLQFSTLDRMTQLMFLDICLYASKALKPSILSSSPLEDLIAWLANIHEQPIEVVRSKIFDFERFAMINLNEGEVIVHDLYKDYAIWFLRQVRSDEAQGIWCVGKGDLGSSLPLELSRTPPGNCLPELKRVRLENISCDSFPVRKVHEWCNTVVLQVEGCRNLTKLDLRGLTCLRHLELKRLRSLKSLILAKDGSSSTGSVSQGTDTEPSQYLLPPLQYVIIASLDSVKFLPSFSPFKSLKFLKIVECKSLAQPPSVQHCSGLKRLWLSWHPNQKTLPSLYGLNSLLDLTIRNTGLGTYKGRALQLVGLNSLISLGALELINIPVGDLSGLGNLTRIEFVSLRDMHYLAYLPELNNLTMRSPLHVLGGATGPSIKNLGGLDEMKSLIKLKITGMAARGEVPYIPSKITSNLAKITNFGLHFHSRALPSTILPSCEMRTVKILERSLSIMRTKLLAEMTSASIMRTKLLAETTSASKSTLVLFENIKFYLSLFSRAHKGGTQMEGTQMMGTQMERTQSRGRVNSTIRSLTNSTDTNSTKSTDSTEWISINSMDSTSIVTTSIVTISIESTDSIECWITINSISNDMIKLIELMVWLEELMVELKELMVKLMFPSSLDQYLSLFKAFFEKYQLLEQNRKELVDIVLRPTSVLWFIPIIRKLAPMPNSFIALRALRAGDLIQSSFMTKLIVLRNILRVYILQGHWA